MTFFYGPVRTILLAVVFTNTVIARAPGADDSAPTAVLLPYLVQGTLVPGDFGWLRGRFADAPASSKADWSAIKAWADAESARKREAVVTALHALGVDPLALDKDYRDSSGDETAELIESADERASQFTSWQEFENALHEARPVFVGYLAATEGAEEITTPDADAPLADKLKAAVVGEQILRRGIHWERAADGPMSASADNVFEILLWQQGRKRDHANTAKLKQIVAKEGWPKISVIGKAASEDAWLLAQHADDDPVFQLQVLRLMQPLVDQHEVSAKDYAYLSDRVGLKTTGKQRFGTQMFCIGGHYGPQGLEDPANVDTIRKSVGLGPLGEYEKQFPDHCG